MLATGKYSVHFGNTAMFTAKLSAAGLEGAENGKANEDEGDAHLARRIGRERRDRVAGVDAGTAPAQAQGCLQAQAGRQEAGRNKK